MRGRGGVVKTETLRENDDAYFTTKTESTITAFGKAWLVETGSKNVRGAASTVQRLYDDAVQEAH